VLASRHSPEVLPGPDLVWERFVSLWQADVFQPAFATTLEETALGWAIGSAIGLPLGYGVSRWKVLDHALGPYIAASQALPLIAIAPLLLEWVGFGIELKVIVAALIALFPISLTTIAGIRAIERDLRDVARAFGANWWQTIVHLEAPQAARSILAGEKIAVALAVVGAFVGELVNPDQGLGTLILSGTQQFDQAEAFVGTIALMFMAAALYAILVAAERMVLKWTT